MIQRFLFDGIDAVTARATIGGEDNLIIQVPPYKAEATLSRMQLAEARAKVALHPAIFKLVPEFGADGVLVTLCHHLQPHLQPSEYCLPDDSSSIYTALP